MQEVDKKRDDKLSEIDLWIRKNYAGYRSMTLMQQLAVRNEARKALGHINNA